MRNSLSKSNWYGIGINKEKPKQKLAIDHNQAYIVIANVAERNEAIIGVSGI